MDIQDTHVHRESVCCGILMQSQDPTIVNSSDLVLMFCSASSKNQYITQSMRNSLNV